MPIITAVGRQEEADGFRLEASVVYIMHFRPAAWKRCSVTFQIILLQCGMQAAQYDAFEPAASTA